MNYVPSKKFGLLLLHFQVSTDVFRMSLMSIIKWQCNHSEMDRG